MARRERPLDESGALPGFAADLRRLRVKAGSPSYRELSKCAHYSATVLSEAAGGRKLPTLAVTLAYVTACTGDTDQWQKRWRELAAELADAEGRTAGGDSGGGRSAPYAGLNAFQSGDADRFFGREQLVTDLLARVRERRFLGVFGASGSGKSSVLRAGVAARAIAEGTPTLMMTPGPHPLEECAVGLAGLAGGSAAALRTELAADPGNLHLRIRQALCELPAGVDLLLVVDQFEEVFTLCHDHDERARFIQALVAAATAATSRVRVVLGVRADFYGHCGQYPHLVDALCDAQVLVGPMSTDELRQAITKPAVRAGCTVETALVSRLIADATGRPGVLPLVSHALLETWRRRRGTRLTVTGYDEAGGIHDAIARSAENVHSRLEAAQRGVARQIFLRLTALGEGTEDTKRRLDRNELDNDDPNTAVVLEQMAHARLVTLDRGSVEISHEALIRCWPRLRNWLSEDREGLRLHRHLTEATDAWETHEHDPGTLYRGTRLALARDWAAANQAALTGRERRFLQEGLAAETAEREAARRRTRRLRHLVALLTVLLVLAATSVAYAVHTQEEVTGQRNIAIARKAASDAAALREANPALSVQVSLAAHRLAPTAATRDNLLSAFATPYASRLAGHTNDLVSLAISPDGRALATASTDRMARLWDVADVRHPRELAVLRHAKEVMAVAFGPGGHTLATVSDRTARLWDVSDRRHPRELAVLRHSNIVTRVAFSPDGRTAATAGSDRTAWLWDVADPRHPRKLAILSGHTGNLMSLAFGPGGHILATAGDHTIRLWDVSDPRQPRGLSVLLGHDANEAVQSVAFSPDGHTVATSGADRTVRLWDITDPHAPRGVATLTGHAAIVYSVAFSPDGRTLASAGDGAWLWDVSDRRHPTHMTTLTGVMSVVFTPDGDTLATIGTDKTARLQDLRELPLVGHVSDVASVAFSPDGHTLATGSWDHTVRLWNVTDPRTRRPTATLTGHTAIVRSVAFSPDGRSLATAGDDGTVRLWDLTDHRGPRTVAVLDPRAAEIAAVAFSPDGSRLATGGYQAVRLWDVADRGNPRQMADLDGYPLMIWSVAFSPDGRTLATSSTGDTTTRLWDVGNPSHPRELAFPFGHTDTVSAGAFSPDKRVLATMSNDNSDDNTVRLVDMTDRAGPRELATLTGHTGRVYAVAFSPDGHTLATVSADKTARLWNVTDPEHPQHLATLTGHTSDVAAVAFSPDGHTLATGSNDGTARLWEADIDQVAARVCHLAYPRITPSEWERYFPGMTYQPPCPG